MDDSGNLKLTTELRPGDVLPEDDEYVDVIVKVSDVQSAPLFRVDVQRFFRDERGYAEGGRPVHWYAGTSAQHLVAGNIVDM